MPAATMWRVASVPVRLVAHGRRAVRRRPANLIAGLLVRLAAELFDHQAGRPPLPAASTSIASQSAAALAAAGFHLTARDTWATGWRSRPNASTDIRACLRLCRRRTRDRVRFTARVRLPSVILGSHVALAIGLILPSLLLPSPSSRHAGHRRRRDDARPLAYGARHASFGFGLALTGILLVLAIDPTCSATWLAVALGSTPQSAAGLLHPATQPPAASAPPRPAT
jgi:hypothetical protein